MVSEKEIEEFLKYVPREHWGGFYIFWKRYSEPKGKYTLKTSYYWYKKKQHQETMKHRIKVEKLALKYKTPKGED